ncbi:non-canonical purine NTP pyrophosphatase [Phragmitibacter flavus]|uniref:dITP/XTP pyrophosphatase n=1 Tax=Phragmitibacter flavus TaxID=2576071 RepID=A0A5R8K8F1_9BACT|nr:non-canonical purine NTP pyrophosphatase [Phragmitibacter flavus]TLD68617.1 non-canonical purine NTP pyrophosphatase [Phragmitibacter flavus]
MKQLLVATGNSHKTEEIRAMLGAGWEVTDLTSHPHLPSPDETGSTFAENAAIKALSASVLLPGVLVLSDDSGLEVDVLDGEPGVHSARYSGASATDASNRRKLIKELTARISSGKQAPFTGRFRCCMVLALDGVVKGVFDGAVEGSLLREEEGVGGFGYDALFVPEGYEHSFGVLPAATKNQLSHRARALAKVIQWLEAQPT